MLEIFLIAISLALDCLAVSIAGGAVYKHKKGKIKYALKTAIFFGLFQMIMPLIGWWAGYGFKNIISNFDHWVAFGLLAAIGLKMIYEGIRNGEDDDKKRSIIDNKTLIILSIATSIDALAVGISFGLISLSLVFTIIIIGFFAFLFSFLGFMTGNKASSFFKGKIEIIGGIVLILIGIKIILEHILNFKLL
ncbi:MAG: manganese efflux pump MntP family protein [Actinobacteria bacterium]|nr:manganese efflux pump MntP family protein [Cyanobacteriota bacterium]MCL5770865.1 manganese efflux pump MntP family protein [Actinomycetota bacterium]